MAHRTVGHVEVDSSEWHLFHRRTQQALNVTVDGLCMAAERYTSGAMSKGTFEEFQMVAGFNANPLGWMADRELRSVAKAAEVGRMDWFHCCLQGGLMNVEMYLFLEATKVPYSHLQTYFQAAWEFPRCKAKSGRALHNVWNEWRNRSNDTAEKFKCSASDLLGVYSLVRHYVHTRLTPTPALALQRTSFLEACNVIDIMQAAKFSRVPLVEAARQLRESLTRLFTAHKAAYGSENLLPKHHWMFDVAEQLEQQSMVYDNFIIERLHLRCKAYANLSDHMVGWEASILRRLCDNQSQPDSSLKVGLQGKVIRDVPGVLPGTLVAGCLENGLGAQIAIGDIVFYDSTAQAGRVKACVLQSGILQIVVEVFSRVKKLSEESGAYRSMGVRHVWGADRAFCATAWYAQEEHLIVLVQ